MLTGNPDPSEEGHAALAYLTARSWPCGNPDLEVRPEAARGHARVVATERSDLPNQINNVLAFPGVFRGARFGLIDGRVTGDWTTVMANPEGNEFCVIVSPDGWWPE